MTRRTLTNLVLGTAIGLAAVAVAVGSQPVDRALPAFASTGASGAVKIAAAGSGRSAAEALTDALSRAGSAVSAGVSGGVPAFTGGTADAVVVSGALSASDVAAFRGKFGYEPTAITLGAEAVAIYVNKDNPVNGLTLQQLDAVFSGARKRGGSPVATWGDLGAGGAWTARGVTPVGVGPAAASHALFKEVVLQGAELRSGTREEAVPSAVVNDVGVNPGAIGFASVGFATKRAKMVPVAAEGSGFVSPTPESCLNGSYPLSRPVTLYVNKKPGAALAAPVAELVNLALSREGQEALAGEGLVTLTAGMASRGREAVR